MQGEAGVTETGSKAPGRKTGGEGAAVNCLPHPPLGIKPRLRAGGTWLHPHNCKLIPAPGPLHWLCPQGGPSSSQPGIVLSRAQVPVQLSAPQNRLGCRAPHPTGLCPSS